MLLHGYFEEQPVERKCNTKLRFFKKARRLKGRHLYYMGVQGEWGSKLLKTRSTKWRHKFFSKTNDTSKKYWFSYINLKILVFEVFAYIWKLSLKVLFPSLWVFLTYYYGKIQDSRSSFLIYSWTLIFEVYWIFDRRLKKRQWEHVPISQKYSSFTVDTRAFITVNKNSKLTKYSSKIKKQI